VNCGYLNGDEGSPADTFYWPLIWLSNHSPVAEAVFSWYVELWAG
jgi:hypothetical protein